MCVLSTLLLLWDITLLCSADSSLYNQDDLTPSEVEFHSVNFRNVLHWKPLPSAPDDLQYFVEYKVYGEKQWSVCEHCQGVRKLHCDLSEETSDPRQWYYARVRSQSSNVLSPWIVSTRFHPQWDTSFSPPQVNLSVTEKGIMVRIRPPRTPAQGAKNIGIPVTRLQRLIFRIYVTHNEEEEEMHETKGCKKKLVVEPLRPRTVYCVQAVTVIPLSGRTSSRSPSSCIRTL